MFTYRYGAAGKWLHLFPEGGIWQNKDYSLGGRSNDKESKLGKLKWGVGKLIAHSPNRPILIPMYHYGMETIVPQDTSPQKRVLTSYPVPGHHVKVVVGPEIEYQDLIQDYEHQHGPLWKYNSKRRSRTSAAIHGHGDNVIPSINTMWSLLRGINTTAGPAPTADTTGPSEEDTCDIDDVDTYLWREEATVAEKELYQKITSRIESSLTQLNLKNKPPQVEVSSV